MSANEEKIWKHTVQQLQPIETEIASKGVERAEWEKGNRRTGSRISSIIARRDFRCYLNRHAGSRILYFSVPFAWNVKLIKQLIRRASGREPPRAASARRQGHTPGKQTYPLLEIGSGRPEQIFNLRRAALRGCKNALLAPVHSAPLRGIRQRAYLSTWLSDKENLPSGVQQSKNRFGQTDELIESASSD